MALPIRLRTIAAAVVVIASGLTIFYSYQSIINSTDGGVQALPIIRADREPFRVMPEDPGGAKIPNQGNKLFNVLNADHGDDLALDGVKIDANDGEPVTLLNDDRGEDGEVMSGFELPVVPEKRTESLYGMIDDLKDDVEPAVDLDQDVSDDKNTPEIVEKDEVLDILDEVQTNDVEPEKMVEPVGNIAIIRPLIKPNPPKNIKIDVKPQTTKSKKSFSLDRILAEEPLQKRHYIQLASLKSKSDAEAFYGRVRDAFPKLVAGVNVFFPQADLGARGTFTRVQIGPLDQADAKSRCADYSASARGGTCLVISR